MSGDCRKDGERKVDAEGRPETGGLD